MSRSLNPREKRLLAACVGTLLIIGNLLGIREFLSRYKTATASLQSLREQASSNRIWLNDRALYEKRLVWLNNTMPYTESAGKSQGQLLEDLRNSALDVGLKVENETPLESLELDYANEVSVSLRLRGDQEIMLRWLLTLQSPEKFVVIKNIEIELDSRSKEKTPQAQCNLTAGRWFNHHPPAGYQPEPAPAPAVENPLQLTTPLDGVAPVESS